jgi:hypothetical protein
MKHFFYTALAISAGLVLAKLFSGGLNLSTLFSGLTTTTTKTS